MNDTQSSMFDQLVDGLLAQLDGEGLTFSTTRRQGGRRTDMECHVRSLSRFLQERLEENESAPSA